MEEKLNRLQRSWREMEEWRTLISRANFNTRIKWTLIFFTHDSLGMSMEAGFVYYSLKWSNLGTREIFGRWFFLSYDFPISSSADVHMCVKWSDCSFPSWIHWILGTYHGFARFTGIPLACIILEKGFVDLFHVTEIKIQKLNCLFWEIWWSALSSTCF